MGDIVIESVGHSAVIQQALASTRGLGQLVLLGTPRAPLETNLTDFLNEVHLRGIVVRGALEWRLPTYDAVELRTFTQYSKQKMIFEWLTSNRLKLAPMLSHTLPPEKIKEAYDGLLNDPGQYTGVVLDWSKK